MKKKEVASREYCIKQIGGIYDLLGYTILACEFTGLITDDEINELAKVHSDLCGIYDKMKANPNKDHEEHSKKEA